MASVYSHRFLVSHGDEPVTVAVPTGYLFVVRWTTAFNPDPVLGATAQIVHHPTEVTIYQQDLAAQVWEGHEHRFVCYPGESLTAQSDNGADITVSGYLLTLP